MSKKFNREKLENQLKTLNSVNRSKEVKERSYHQIMNRLHEPKKTSFFLLLSKILSPILLTLAVVSLFLFIGINIIDEQDGRLAEKQDRDKQTNLADYEFDPSSIQLNDKVAEMTLVDGRFIESEGQKRLLRGTFEGEVELSGTVFHNANDTLSFSLDEEYRKLLPIPSGKLIHFFSIQNDDWLKKALDSDPGDTFTVVMTIDQFHIEVLGSEVPDTLHVQMLLRHYTKRIEEITDGGTYTNDTYGYTFDIPMAWEGNVIVEENKSVTTFYHTCQEESTRQVYLQLFVSKENLSTTNNDLLAKEGDYFYSYRKPLDLVYVNEQCLNDFKERYQEVFSKSTPDVYFHVMGEETDLSIGDVRKKIEDILQSKEGISEFTIDSFGFSHRNEKREKVYTLTYSMKPSDPETFVLAGSGVEGEDGWIKERIFYVTTKENGKLSFATSP